ncbi:MAG: carbonic anhydrase, partial [Sphingopyxis sp.]
MTTNLSPDAALSLLKDGNRRFLAGEPYTPILDRRVRLELAAAQHLSCSDSRVPPELLFERGLGELFIVRNAGNSLCNTAIGSLEFAVINLGVPLIVVMGHQQCGAMRAAVAMVREQRRYSARIDAALHPLLPAVL